MFVKYMSYRSALTQGLSVSASLSLKTKFWDTTEVPEPPFYTHKGETFPNTQYPFYETLARLRQNKIFQNKFRTFAENKLCIENADARELRLNIPDWGLPLPWPGKVKKYTGLYLQYSQDTIVYNIVYEYDDPKDPSTGWFFQWVHNDDCCAFSCDYYGCLDNYGPK